MIKVLVAVDRSEFWSVAVQAVARQFRPDRVEVQLLHVLDPRTYVPLYEGAVHDSRRVEVLVDSSLRQAHELVERAAKLLLDSGYRVTTAIEEGEPKTTIVAYAKQIKADMIVVSSHSRHGLRRLLLGSVAEYVARHAPCTVEIARPQASLPPAGTQ